MAFPHRFLAALALLIGWCGHAGASCGPLLPQTQSAGSTKRPIAARDLIEIRDIGDAESGNYGAASRLAVSPDGRQVAFSLIRADLPENDYCIGIFVSAIAPSATPLEVNAGGEPIPEQDNLRGYLVPSGGHMAVVPAWSPDGRRLAFLRRDGGVTRLWVASASGGRGHPVTQTEADVEAFAWSGDGTRLIFATRPATARARADYRREGKSGWLYDRRFLPPFGPAPLVAADTPRLIQSIGHDGGVATAASSLDAARLSPDDSPGMPPLAVAADGRRASTERQGTSLLAPLALLITDRHGQKIPCIAEWCRGGITGLWWAPDGQALYVMRREGWNRGDIALYRWTPGGSAGHVFRTSDEVRDCGLARRRLVCTRGNATTPRRIVAIDLADGTSRVVFDPNPQFAAIALGQVQRLKARNALGLESWADLVLPPGHKSGDRLPLVIVQYHSDGFLRGGTGDEYPVHLLAARGFAVLSFERPPFFAAAYPDARSAFELNALNLKDWAERRSILSSLLAEVDLAIATGSVDPGRIGITGLSDGASTVQFAMINSDRFAAASVSSCCFDPRSVTTYAGIAFSEYIQKMGFPGATRDDPEFWKANSLAISGRQTNTPLLMQLADREYLGALESFQALREYGKPVELYVFPDEYHDKRQPTHRLAIYQRNLDWFGFWLQDRIDPDPAKSAQYARWRAIRTARTPDTP